jgi:hypothetical protein
MHLTFPEHLISEPMIQRIGTEFGLVTNIHRRTWRKRWASAPSQVAFSGFAGLDTTVEFDKAEGALGLMNGGGPL